MEEPTECLSKHIAARQNSLRPIVWQFELASIESKFCDFGDVLVQVWLQAGRGFHPSKGDLTLNIGVPGCK